MQDRPTAAEVLATLVDYLTDEVQPNVSGTLRYHTLVAINLARMLQREIDLYPVAAARERAALCRLLDVEPLGDAVEQLLRLNSDLAGRLRAGTYDDAFERSAWLVLSDAVQTKLTINKPGYDAYDSAQELSQ